MVDLRPRTPQSAIVPTSPFCLFHRWIWGVLCACSQPDSLIALVKVSVCLGCHLCVCFMCGTGNITNRTGNNCDLPEPVHGELSSSYTKSIHPDCNQNSSFKHQLTTTTRLHLVVHIGCAITKVTCATELLNTWCYCYFCRAQKLSAKQ